MTQPGRTALVTGGARRVGRAIVESLAAAGFQVAIHYLQSAAEAEALTASLVAQQRSAAAFRADLRVPAQRARLVEDVISRFGGINVLINNASLFEELGPDTLEAFDADRFARMFEVNVVAPVALVHHAATSLRASRGCVVNMCDIAADRPWKRHLAYCASKAALVNLTKSLAVALAPEVRVLGVAPGIAVFPEDYDQERRHALVEAVPLQRAGTPQETGELVRFMVEGGGYMTGQVVTIDGGRSLTW